jgi:hypothetical protein
VVVTELSPPTHTAPAGTIAEAMRPAEKGTLKGVTLPTVTVK